MGERLTAFGGHAFSGGAVSALLEAQGRPVRAWGVRTGAPPARTSAM